MYYRTSYMVGFGDPRFGQRLFEQQCRVDVLDGRCNFQSTSR